MNSFDWPQLGSNMTEYQSAIERDVQGLWEIVDFWSSRLTFAIDRYEASRRRFRLFIVGGATGVALGSTAFSVASMIGATPEAILTEGRVSGIVAAAGVALSTLSMLVLLWNEFQNITTQRREITDIFHVFKDVQEMFISTIDAQPQDHRYRTLADARGRMMMMSYIERKAYRYVAASERLRRSERGSAVR
ncbi:hypothetical protein [Rhizobium sp. 21-4511-3d]